MLLLASDEDIFEGIIGGRENLTIPLSNDLVVEINKSNRIVFVVWKLTNKVMFKWKRVAVMPRHKCGDMLYCYDNMIICETCKEVVEL